MLKIEKFRTVHRGRHSRVKNKQSYISDHTYGSRTAFFRVITQQEAVIPSNIPGHLSVSIFKDRGSIACAGVTLNVTGTYYKSYTLVK